MFGPSHRRLVGFFHPPARLPSSGLGVVLCNPIGYEAMSGHRTYRHLAERLAARGFAALRFDYDGTGDSSGESDDGDRVQAWLGSVEAAIAELAVLADNCRIGLFGARFGGTLAALAAARRGGVECLIPWGPVVSGRKHVRELRAFRLLRTPRGGAAAREDGGEEVGGYYFGRQTLADIGAVDLLAGTGHVAKRALLLGRDHPGGEEAALADHFRAHGTDVRLAAQTGYARMMRDDPYESEVPFETLEAIVDWLDECRYPETRTPLPRARSAAESLSVSIRSSPVAIRETPLVFGEQHRLFGVLSEPDGPVPSHRPALCLLNVGANPHVGPQRMNVDLARTLASAGYLAFRFDAAGLGESRCAPGARENRIYMLDAIADVQSAMTLLARLRGPRRFVLVGLCSGAYLAYHAAIADARVAGQVLINPYAFEWKEGDPVAPRTRTIHSTRFYSRALLDPATWPRALRGDVDAMHIARRLVERLKSRMDSVLPDVSARLLGQRAPTNHVERAFSMLCDRGVESSLVSSFDDGGIDMVAGYLGTDARKMRGRKNFTFEIVSADHTFATIASQELLRGILGAYVAERFP